jgi:hypothetical protein
MALALSQTRQLLRKMIHSISHRVFPTTYGRYRSTLSETLVIFKARAMVKPHRLREAGHSPVVPVIAHQVMQAMGPAMRRTLIPTRLRNVNKICDLSLTVWSSCCIILPVLCKATLTEPELVCSQEGQDISGDSTISVPLYPSTWIKLIFRSTLQWHRIAIEYKDRGYGLSEGINVSLRLR